MGCGMVIKSVVARKIFPLDDTLLKWFDDVEVGIRVWRSGHTVRLAQDAIVDHLYQTADAQIAPNHRRRAFYFEAARIRHALKYTPGPRIWRWLIEELRANFNPARPRHLVLGFLVWGWNLAHLPSALRVRRVFSPTTSSFEPPVVQSWGRFP